MTDAQNIRQLTALRFFAAFWVVLFHYWPNLQAAPAPLLVDKGYLGVELFFILSGFILCHVYRTSVEERRFRYGSFLWARLARVYPLHLATLVGLGLVAGAATVAGFAVDQNILSWEALPANLLLVQAWGFAPVAGWNHPSWSISAEWFAYLTFPAFAWAALKLKDRPRVAVLAAIAFLAGLYLAFEAATGKSLTQATIHWGALRIVPCFAYGCALHALWRGTKGSGRAVAAAGALVSGALVLVFAALGVHDSVTVAALGGVIFFLARLAESGSKAFGNPSLVYLGEISYSVYMICVPWKIVFVNAATRIFELRSDQLPLPLWIAFSIAVIPLAAASYHLIEKPARARMKTWADSWEVRRPSVAGV
jgi:peptidoglycan/LPS O-acetylase OafA/YrhL